jgi:hypothetical protein
MEEASEICRYQSEDGTTIMQEEQNIWRLPTVGRGGTLPDAARRKSRRYMVRNEEKAVYIKPLIRSLRCGPCIRKSSTNWTADISGDDDTRASIIVYHEAIYDRRKTDSQYYLSFGL